MEKDCDNPEYEKKCYSDFLQLAYYIGLFRHGDRSPTDDFPSDPYDEDVWPNGYNQLTPMGIRQARDLGKFLRTRYTGFLNDTYITDELYVRSSDTDRTLMSASALLAGLYPPQGFQVWDPQIPWQPIPVHSVPLEDDILTVDGPCPYYNTIWQRALSSPEASTLLQENKEMIEYVGEQAGWVNVTLQNIWDTYDPLYCMVEHNLPLPSWVTTDVYNWLQEIFYKEADYWYFYDEQIYLKAGPFMKYMTDKMKQGTTTSFTKMSLYASHDSLIAGVFFALGLWNNITTPYSSALIFELHESQPQDYIVRLFYKNDTTTNPQADPLPLTLPGCSADCPLADFLSINRRFTYQGTTEDLWTECTDRQEAVLEGRTDVLVVSILAFGFIIALLGILCCCLLCRNTSRTYNEKMPIANNGAHYKSTLEL